MSRCRNCNIEILDVTESCPLCKSVLEQTEELENMYPYVTGKTKRLVFFSRLYLLAVLLVEAVLVWVDMNSKNVIKWSLLAGLIFFYIFLVLRYAVIGKSGYKSKISVLTLITIIGAIAIDYSTGYRGWSVDYVISGGIIVTECAILGLMFFNRRNWQSYIIWQIAMILCSMIPVILYMIGIEHNKYAAYIPLELSGLIFLGTMIMGGRRSKLELYRRFHI